MWSARHRKAVALAWVIIVVAALGACSAIEADTSVEGEAPGESGEAQALIEQRFPAEQEMPQEFVVFSHPSLSVDDPTYRETVEGLLGALSTLRAWKTEVVGGTTVVHSSRIVAYPPGIIGQMRPARITMTWGAGTISVQDVSRGYTLPFVEYPDQDYGWGFVTKTAYGGAWEGVGQLYQDMLDGVSFTARTAKMVQSLPADNTEEFGIWANGVLYVFQGEGGVLGGMPASGTVMTADNVFGSWNGDKTVFTQFQIAAAL